VRYGLHRHVRSAGRWAAPGQRVPGPARLRSRWRLSPGIGTAVGRSRPEPPLVGFCPGSCISDAGHPVTCGCRGSGRRRGYHRHL